MKNQVVLVTGGASGMGAAIARHCAARGARVVINYRASQAAAAEVEEQIVAAGGTAMTWQADVSDEAAVRRMMAAIGERHGHLDHLVNNAGWSRVTPHEDLAALTDEIWDRTLDTNLRGAFYCVRAAVPLLRASPGAPSIINNTSASAWHAAGSSIVYSASKAALINMTRSLARALAPAIRVNAFAPGLVETDFASWPTGTFEAGRQVTPLERLATVDDIAEAVLYLAGARAITGETLLIDGGIVRLGKKQDVATED